MTYFWQSLSRFQNHSLPRQVTRSPRARSMVLRFRKPSLTFVLRTPFSPVLKLIKLRTTQRVMGHIASGKKEGAKILFGGERLGTEGYFIKPTMFTDTTPDMKIMQEEIFGPVGAFIKFKTEEGKSSFCRSLQVLLSNFDLSASIFAEVIKAANNTPFGLGCHIFSENISRAIRVTQEMEAGTVWVSHREVYTTFTDSTCLSQVNCASVPEIAIPIGRYKQSGIGRDFGEYALDTFVTILVDCVDIY
jgi:aldehyde dehydrogenase (NAD+)